MKVNKIVTITLFSGFILAGLFILYAYSKTWGKTSIEFRIHINEHLILESTYGEPPTFAIWMEDPETGAAQTIFVTSRAGLGDWEGKAEVPVALPSWFALNKRINESKEKMPGIFSDYLAITGATPQPGYFVTRVNVKPGSNWICWIEVNLAGDYNDTYREYDEAAKTYDEFKTGQPALLYRADITAENGKRVVPEIEGMTFVDNDSGFARVMPLNGITTAKDIFDDISIFVTKPKPRILPF